jgi:hypothetical protein
MFGFRVTTPLRTLEDLAADPSISQEQFDKAVSAATERGLIRRSQAKPLLAKRRDGKHPKAKAVSR